MSAHYSKFDLNTYCGSAYFRAHVPADYPLRPVLEKCRAFRRLPPRLRELAALAKRWTTAHSDYPAGIEDIERWYDALGNETDPLDGHVLTDQENDANWKGLPVDPAFVVRDIPVPPGGFADPDTWQEPPPPPEPDTDDPGITEDQLVRDIASHGREYVAKDYGLPAGAAASAGSDRDLARLILARLRGTP